MGILLSLMLFFSFFAVLVIILLLTVPVKLTAHASSVQGELGFKALMHVSFARIGYRISYAGKKSKNEITFLKYSYTLPEKAEQAEPEKAAEKTEELKDTEDESTRSEQYSRFLQNKNQTSKLVHELLPHLKSLIERIRLENILIRARLANMSPADAGRFYGHSYAVKAILTPFKKITYDVFPEFKNNETFFETCLKISVTRPLFVIITGIRIFMIPEIRNSILKK